MLDTVNIAFTFAIATVVLLFYIGYSVLFRKSMKEQELNEENTQISSVTKEESKASSKPAASKQGKEQKKYVQPTKAKDANTFKHKLLAGSLKAHSDIVTGIEFSSNGKYLLSCGNDRAIFMWSTKEFESPTHKSIRCNVEFDHATKVRFSPDSRSFIAALGASGTIRAFKIVKKEDANIHIIQAAIEDFPQKHKTNLVNIGLSCSGRFIMTCSSDTTVNIWNVKGDLLGTIDTRLMNNTFACVSTCGRFFGVCGFTPDVKIWEVLFDKTDNFREIKRAYELKGHSAGVYCFSFNSDSTRIASVSKDQTWKLWDTNINYEKGQDAKELLSINLPTKGASLIALSPDSYTVAVTVDSNLYFYDALTGKLDETVENCCNDKISEICFSADSKYLALACDRHVKVFYNITGHRVTINDYESKLKTAKTQTAKERIEQTIEEHRLAEF